MSPGADAAVLGVAYRLDLDEDSWLSALSEALRTRYGLPSAVLACELDHHPDTARLRVSRTAPAGPLGTLSRHLVTTCEALPAETVRRLLGTRTGASTLARRLEAAGLRVCDIPPLSAAGGSAGLADIWGISVVLPDSRRILFLSPLPAAGVFRPDELAAATELATKIEAAARARAFLSRRPDTHGLVFSPEGRLEHADGTPVPEELTDALTRGVVTTEQARSGGQQEFRIRDAELLWDDILDEGWRLVHYTDVDDRRLIVGVRAEDAGRTPPALTPRERQVVTMASRAATNKEIAAELGLSLSTVATHLRNALAKLHVGSRRELIALRRALTGLVERF